MTEWTNDLISALVYCDADNDIIETLQQLSAQQLLNGWNITKTDIPGSYPWCLTRDGISVHLQQCQKNIAKTVNVLPVDSEENASKSNKYINELHEIFNDTNGILESFI
ncbi:hypothetical protein [Escherichia coli]|uniref:hypothetical protein n=1 Tax=Escherichia coli TaxID=562 RepID=UPI000854A5CD|nr:hypothetical protein [Escherichia coli]EKT5515784.1 hypothetical protein [Escherichia coli]MCQ1638815.1 hypothetical protein [Escherichia coli]OEO03939.1 hypothetical protein BHF60_20430 [Escherichia coli]